MFCNKCGKQGEDGMRFCPFCGEPVAMHQASPPPPPYTPPYNNGGQYGQQQQQPYGQPYGQQPYSQQPYGQQQYGYPPPPPPPTYYGAPYQPYQPITRVHTVLKNVFESQVYFALCVINTVIGVISLSSSGGADLLSILVIALLWILRDIAVKQKHPSQLVKHLKTLKVVTVVHYVILWVAVAILGIVGFTFLFIPSSPFEAIDITEVMSGFEAEILETVLGFSALLGLAFMILAGVLALYNIYFIGNCKKLAESVVRSCETGLPMFEKIDTVRKWFKVMGIFNLISAVTSFTSLFSFFFPLNVAIMIESLISGSLSAVLYLLFAKCLNDMKALLYGQTNI